MWLRFKLLFNDSFKITVFRRFSELTKVKFNLQEMPENDIKTRIAENFKRAEDLLKSMKQEVHHVENVIKQQVNNELVTKLKAENMQLKEELEFWQAKVIELESLRGIEQVPLPYGCSNLKLNTSEKEASISVGVSSQPEPLSKVKCETDNPPAKKEKKEAVKKEKPAKAKGDATSKDDSKDINVSRLDLRIGRILRAEKHPDAESLYVEQIDVAEEKPRTVVSGLVKFVPLEEMQNRLVVVLCNLKPAKMRGILSEAMVMCASTPEKVEILEPPETCIPGDRVTCDDYVGEPDALLNPKKKIFEQVASDLKTNDSCIATYKSSVLKVTNKGVIKAPTLSNVIIK